MEVGGLPLHPLIVHATIGLVPLAALFALVTALVPGWRWFARWGTLLTALGALLVVVVTRASGMSLLEDRYGGQPRIPEQLQTHQDRAQLLLYAVIVLAVVAVLAFLLLPARSALVSGKLEHTGSTATWVGTVVPALLVLAGLAALVLVVMTGDAGARSVWGS
ncbi:DUF2231 domain-containing protein [Nocardioides caldifontis]|uniref:DUF2231 domain-containing protein n=1 Tax=Nocardioides caldifontis TaxID=2588938 RepID=UPI0011DFEF1F|nr:DUF2231 domain-containing protein [Nocardioides caldifontis]